MDYTEQLKTMSDGHLIEAIEDLNTAPIRMESPLRKLCAEVKQCSIENVSLIDMLILAPGIALEASYRWKECLLRIDQMEVGDHFDTGQ